MSQNISRGLYPEEGHPNREDPCHSTHQSCLWHSWRILWRESGAWNRNFSRDRKHAKLAQKSPDILVHHAPNIFWPSQNGKFRKFYWILSDRSYIAPEAAARSRPLTWHAQRLSSDTSTRMRAKYCFDDRTPFLVSRLFSTRVWSPTSL